MYNPSVNDMKCVYDGAIRAYIVVPSVVEPGERFIAYITMLRIDSYPDESYNGVLYTHSCENIRGIPKSIEIINGFGKIEDIYVEEEGMYRIYLKHKDGNYFPSGFSNAIWCVKDPQYRIYWGDLHVHSVLGKCGTPFLPKSPDYGYWYARYVVRHNFCSITDHASALTDEDWEVNLNACRRWHKDNEFVSILGFEGDYNGEDGGHFNFYHKDDKGTYINFKADCNRSLNKMFKYAEENNALAISHHNGRDVCGRDYDKSRFSGKKIEPVVEVLSQWGSSEEFASERPIVRIRHTNKNHYFNYAIKKGYRFGAVGGSDSHTTTPGGLVPMAYPTVGGKILFSYPGGITGVYTNSLTRKAILEGIRQRRCFASNDRIIVWLSINASCMGNEIVGDEAELDIKVYSSGERIARVSIIKNGEVYKVYEPNAQQFNLKLIDKDIDGEASYYIKVYQWDGDMAISSPIWVKKS